VSVNTPLPQPKPLIPSDDVRSAPGFNTPTGVGSNPPHFAPDLRSQPAVPGVTLSTPTDVSTTTVVQLNRGSMGSIFIYLLLLVGAAGGVYWYVTRDAGDTAVATEGVIDPSPSVKENAAGLPIDRDKKNGEPGKSDRKATSPSDDDKSDRDKSDRDKSDRDKGERDKGERDKGERDKGERDKGDRKVASIDPKNGNGDKVDKAAGPPRDTAEAQAILTEARAAEAQMQWQKARALYERVAAGSHRRSDGLLGMANIAFQTRDFDASIEYARNALQSGGGDNARMRLGHALLKKGRYDDAIAQYRAVLKSNPKHREAQRALREAENQKKKQK
jgi:hypothetical protein